MMVMMVRWLEDWLIDGLIDGLLMLTGFERMSLLVTDNTDCEREQHRWTIAREA